MHERDDFSKQITPKEVDNEMRAAIKAAGYDMEPELFIVLAAAKVNSEISKSDE